MYRDKEFRMSNLDYFVIMDAKWWVQSDDENKQSTCYAINHKLTSYDGNSKTRFVLVTDDESITIERINTAAEMYFKYEGATKVQSFIQYKGSKVDAIRSAISELAKDAVYLVLDEENYYYEFPGRSVILDLENFEACMIMACRYLKYGYWWNYKHRDASFGYREYIDDDFKNVIFLDVDGVLNADDYEDTVRLHENKIALLAEIVKATNAEIILSSSWRRGISSVMEDPVQSEGGRVDWGLELIRLMAKYRLTIAGVTEDLHSGPDARPLEIRTWLAKRISVLNFVILDDEDFWTWNWLSPHSVLTVERYTDEEGRLRRKAGLTQKNVDKAIEILNLYKKPERRR